MSSLDAQHQKPFVSFLSSLKKDLNWILEAVVGLPLLFLRYLGVGLLVDHHYFRTLGVLFGGYPFGSVLARNQMETAHEVPHLKKPPKQRLVQRKAAFINSSLEMLLSSSRFMMPNLGAHGNWSDSFVRTSICSFSKKFKTPSESHFLHEAVRSPKRCGIQGVVWTTCLKPILSSSIYIYIYIY